MIKSFIYILLSTTVFFCSAGIWINNQYCQEKLIKSSLYFSFGGCCDSDVTATCANEKMGCTEEDHVCDKGCCENKPDYYSIDQDQLLQVVKFESPKEQISIDANFPAFLVFLPKVDLKTFRYINYSAPPIVFDRQVRLQTFLC